MHNIFKKSTKRMISAMLVFAMLVGSLSYCGDLSSFSVLAAISDNTYDSTGAVLGDLVRANVKNHGIEDYQFTNDEVIAALKAVGDEMHVTGGSDEESGQVYDDDITSVPIYKIIQELFENYNEVKKKAIIKEAEEIKAENEKAKKAYEDEKKKIEEENAEADEENQKSLPEEPTYKEVPDVNAYVDVTYNIKKSVGYSGGTLANAYTYLNLITDYVREKEPAAQSLYDDKIEGMVTERVKTVSTNISMSAITDAVKQYIKDHTTELVNYNEMEYVDSFTSPHTVTFFQYTQTHFIDPGTLFIGTYLIDASAINDVYYRYAKDSMGIMSQNIMYYKSELDGGNWKDIISAAGLSDILPTSTTVPSADLNKYKITCVVGKDGIPRYPDLPATDPNSECDIFTMTDPYDMAAVPELVKLKLMFDAGVVSQNTADLSNRYTADILYRFFNYDGCGDNKSMMIIRNRGYRDYVYDHPEDGKTIVGQNPIPMSEKLPAAAKDIKKFTYITKEEIMYVTDLQDKALHLSCNMAQTVDRYQDHPDAWIDQILSWMEYYGNRKFNNVNGGRPIILPIEDMADSQWERLNFNQDPLNPQRFMFIVNGVPSTGDQREFINRWMSDSGFQTGSTHYEDSKGNRVDNPGDAYGFDKSWYDLYKKNPIEKYNVFKDNNYSNVKGDNKYYLIAMGVNSETRYVAAKATYEYFKNIENGTYKEVPDTYYLTYDYINANKDKMNFVFYAQTGVYDGGQTFNLKFVEGQKWKDFKNLIYRYMDWLRNMYDIRDDVTYTCDDHLKNLNALYKKERNAGRIDQANTLMELMSHVDATRRAEIYYNLVFNEDNNVVLGPSLMYVLDLLMDGKGKVGQNYTFISGDTDGSYASNDAILTAVEDAVENCQKKYYDYASMSLSDSENLLKEKEYELSNLILASRNDTDRSTYLDRLDSLYNIMDMAIVDKDREKTMIDELLEESEERYAEKIHDVASPDYTELASTPGVTKATLRANLELQKDEANTKVSELQFLIRGYALRSNMSQGILFINRRLDWAQAQAADIQMEDPFGAFAKESLDEHIKWLKDILAKVKNGTLSGDDTEDVDADAYLQGDLLDALDNNDFELATKIGEEERDPNAGGSGTGDDGNGGAGGGDGDGGLTTSTNPFQELIDKLEEKILDDPDGANRDPKPLIEALGQLGDANLPNLKNSLVARGVDESIINAVDDAIEKSKSSSYYDGTGDDGSGNKDTGNGPRLSYDDLLKLIESLFGKAFADLDDDEKAIVVAACTRYGNDYTYPEVSEFGRGVMYQALDENNGFFYRQFTADTSEEYVNLAAVDKTRRQSCYRYVKRGREVIMSQINRPSMSGSYVFTVGSNIAYNRSKRYMDLSKNVVQQTDEYVRGSLTRNYAYLDEGDAQKLLGVTCQYVPQSIYAVYLSGNMETKATAFYELIVKTVNELEANSKK